MARSVLASGTQTAVINTVYALKDDTSNEGSAIDGYMNLSNMATGDTTIITVSVKLLTGGALAVYLQRTFTGAQTEQTWYIPPVTEAKEYKLSLQQTTGTGRAYDWTLYKS